MELYLSHNDLPIVLTKPGLLDVPVATVGTAVAGGTQATAPDATVTQGTEIAPTGDDAGQLTVRRSEAWPEVGNGSGQVSARYQVNGAWHNLPITRGGTGNKDLTLTFPETARTGSVPYEIFTGSGGTRTFLADGSAPFATRTATDDQGGGGAVRTPNEAARLRGLGTTDTATPVGRQAETVRTGLRDYGTATSRAMYPTFTNNTTHYWLTDSRPFTPENVTAMHTQLTGDRAALQREYEGLADNATNRSRRTAIRSQMTWLDDRITRADRLQGIATKHKRASDGVANGGTEFAAGRDFLATYNTRVEGLGGTVTAGYLNDSREVSSVDTHRDASQRRVAGDGNGSGAGNQSAGFTETLQGINQGINTVAGTVHSGANVTDALGRFTRSAVSIPPNSGYRGGGFGPYGGGYGGFGGGFGGMGPMGLMGPNRQQDQEEESRKITMLLQMLMHAIQAGNTDAIGTALTFIAMRGKKTLLKAAARTVRAMESFERQQRTINTQMASLNAEGNPNYQSQMMTLTNDMNVYSSNRQAIVNFLRDVKSMVDELENMEKSWYDVALRQRRQLTSFQA